MIYTIKAIPTTYAGVNFRSRLEARWAALFDLSGIKWDYEPFDLDGWAPDFLLRIGGCSVLVEIKPVDLTLIVENAVQQNTPAIPLPSYEKAIKHKNHHCVLLLGIAPIDTSLLSTLGIVLGRRDVGEIDDVMHALMSVERVCPQTGEVTTALALWREAGSNVQWRPDESIHPDSSKLIDVTAIMHNRKKHIEIRKAST